MWYISGIVTNIKHMKKFNNTGLGTIIGAILPIIAFFIFYTSSGKGQTLSEFFDYLKVSGITTSLISILVLPNLIIFFIFLNTNRHKTVKGIMGATLVYTIFVFILYFSIKQ